MKRFPRIRRAVRRGALAILGLLVVLAAFVQIQQRLLRRRAERLLSDMRGLELRKSTWADAQAIMRRWGAWGHYEGPCVEQRCVYKIELVDSLSAFVYKHPKIFEHLRGIETPYELLGGRPALIQGWLSVVDGVVWGKRFVVFVNVPPKRVANVVSYGRSYTLIGEADSVSRFSSWLGAPPAHPNYDVYRPGGCTMCLAVYANFTPYADPEDVRRLMDFDLSCITRWTPCREPGELMPAAWRQHLADDAAYEAAREATKKCKIPLDRVGRDAANVVLADVVDSRKVKDSVDGERFLTMKLVRRLKRASFWEPGTTLTIKVADSLVSHTAHDRASDIAPGGRFILIFTHGWQRDIRGNPCGMLPYTADNLALIESGIEQDYASRLP